MHEVSEDGVSWNRASAYPDLFRGGDSAVVVAGATVVEEVHEAPDNFVVSATATLAPPPAPTGAGGWYYSLGGQQQGPVPFMNLQSMIHSGQLSSSSLVWSNGMSQWLPASQIDGLGPVPLAPIAAGGEGPSAGVVVQLSEARPWLLFFAILSTLATIACFVGGVVLLIQSAKVSEMSRGLASTLAVQGIGGFVQGIITCVSTVLLYAICGRIRDFTYHKTNQTLEAALRKGKHLLVYWGVLTIVGIVFLIITVIFVMAVE
jgi:hypothetical protein